MSAVAYNPSDPTQTEFLSALALGESGSSGGLYLGVGGSNLSHDPTNAFGFPEWSGVTTPAGPSHAAGVYQFQPGTWDSIASQYGLNFGNAADQNAGAWYLAQQKDPTLAADLQAGNVSKIQSLLGSTWTSITGSKFAQALSGAIPGANIPAGASSPAATSGTASTGIITDIENWFLRGGLILVGGLVVVIALWGLISHYTGAPSPVDVGKTVAKAA